MAGEYQYLARELANKFSAHEEWDAQHHSQIDRRLGEANQRMTQIEKDVDKLERWQIETNAVQGYQRRIRGLWLAVAAALVAAVTSIVSTILLAISTH